MEKRKSMKPLDKKKINEKYVIDFIESMEFDYDKWKLDVHSSLDGPMREYRSPKYGDVVFGFGYSFCGAWINGYFKWSVPYSIYYNPFNHLFWGFHRAKSKVKKHLNFKLQQEYLNELNNAKRKS